VGAAAGNDTGMERERDEVDPGQRDLAADQSESRRSNSDDERDAEMPEAGVLREPESGPGGQAE
jgi:hypothetical protein